MQSVETLSLLPSSYIGGSTENNNNSSSINTGKEISMNKVMVSNGRRRILSTKMATAECDAGTMTTGGGCVPCKPNHFCIEGKQRPCKLFEASLAGASVCGCAPHFVLFENGCVPRPPPVCPAGYEVRDVLRHPVCEPCPKGTWNEENGERCRLLPPPPVGAKINCSIQGGEPTLDGGCGCPPNTQLQKKATEATDTMIGDIQLHSRERYECVPCPNGTQSTNLGLSPCVRIIPLIRL